MSTKKIKFIVAITLALTFTLVLVIGILAQNAEEVKYVGTKKCKMCHSTKKENETKKHKLAYNSWIETSHAKNFQFLKDMGKDADPECLKCHTTGYGKPGGFVDEAATPNLVGTGCEACHGPGSKHIKAKPKKGSMGEVKKGVCEECHMPHGGHPELGKEILPVLKKKLSELQEEIAGLEGK